MKGVLQVLHGHTKEYGPEGTDELARMPPIRIENEDQAQCIDKVTSGMGQFVKIDDVYRGQVLSVGGTQEVDDRRQGDAGQGSKKVHPTSSPYASAVISESRSAVSATSTLIIQPSP